MALNQDKDALEGRSKTFAGEIPEASLRDQSPKKLLNKLKELNVGQQVTELWRQGNANRQEHLDTQTKLIHEFEEFVSPIYQGAYAWSSTVHLPTSYVIVRSFHSRMLATLQAFDPFFTAVARKAANEERAPLVQDLLRYTLKDWANDNNGIDEALDRWVWSWVTVGRGVVKSRWERKFSRIIDVVEKQKPGPPKYSVDEQGNEVSTPTVQTVEVEEETVIKTFDGPQIEPVLNEDVLIVGGDGDIDRADAVIQQTYPTASDLWSLVDQGIYDKDAVAAIIKGGPSLKSTEAANHIKQERVEVGQDGSLDVPYDDDRYQILEAYIRKVVDGSGIATEIVCWVNPNTREIVRATYLHRISKSGKRPYACIDFHRRTDTSHPVGLVELTYSLCKEMDAMHNMRVDYGMLSTLPFGFYRASSSMSNTKMPLEPGAMIPLDSPQTDVFFPNLGNRTSFGFQEEQALYQQIERMTSISDLSLGILGNQGAARTATGSRIVSNENSSNLDVYLKRMNRGVKRLLHLVFEQVQMRIDPGMQFRLMGDDGNQYFSTVQSREEIAGMYDFEIDGSSSSSNRQVQIDTAQQLYQLTQNPLDYQLGLFTPAERFEAVKNLMQALGVKSFSKFLRKPEGAVHRYTPEELANRVLAGVDTRLDPAQDLQGFIDYCNYIFEHDELLGSFNEQQAVALARKMQEAQQMQEALKQAAAQQANANQMSQNAAMSINQTSPGMAPAGGGVPGAAG